MKPQVTSLKINNLTMNYNNLSFVGFFFGFFFFFFCHDPGGVLM